MHNNYLGIINLNECEDNIRSLTKNRPIASIPLGGRYRLIDFTLSNMVNSGVKNIGIFTQSDSRSLVDHLATGKPWDLDRKNGGLYIFNYSINNSKNVDIDMFKNNFEFLNRSKEENVIISSSHMLCNIDYEKVVKLHEKSNADITLIYKNVNNGDSRFFNCHTLNIDDINNIISIGKNMGAEAKVNISLDMFLMKKSTLINIINDCVQTGSYSSLNDAIYKNLSNYNVNCYEFTGYFQCINSINQYFRANLDMLNHSITNELCYKNGPIYTKVKDEPPSKYFEKSLVENSLISNGCIIKGNVKSSILSTHVTVHENSSVENCIILQGCEIGPNCKLKNVIIDKYRVIEKNSKLIGTEEFPLVIEKNTSKYRL